MAKAMCSCRENPGTEGPRLKLHASSVSLSFMETAHSALENEQHSLLLNKSWAMPPSVRSTCLWILEFLKVGTEV